MSRQLPLHPRFVSGIGLALLVACLPVLSGCGEKNPVYPGPITSETTPITGTYTGRADGGALTLNIAARRIGLGDPHTTTTSSQAGALMNPVAVTGLMTTETGDTSSLIGTYFQREDSLVFSGGGYSFSGIVVVYLRVLWITGRYTGPSDNGAFICLVGAPDTVRTFCGTFRSDSTTASGRWNFSVRGDTLVGFALDQDSRFELGFFSLLTGMTAERQFQAIAGSAPSNTYYWLGSVDAFTGLASGTWLGFTGGILRERGPWSAVACSLVVAKSP